MSRLKWPTYIGRPAIPLSPHSNEIGEAAAREDRQVLAELEAVSQNLLELYPCNWVAKKRASGDLKERQREPNRHERMLLKLLQEVEFKDFLPTHFFHANSERHFLLCKSKKVAFFLDNENAGGTIRMTNDPSGWIVFTLGQLGAQGAFRLIFKEMLLEKLQER